MVIYKDKWKIDIIIPVYEKRIVLEEGVYVKNNNLLFEDKDLTNFRYFEQLLDKTNNYINEKANEFFKYIGKKKDIRSEWLHEWLVTEKKDIIGEIQKFGLLNPISSETIDTYEKVINSYYNYFMLIDKEEALEDRYEEFFNTLLQMPTEIKSVIITECFSGQGEFKKDAYVHKQGEFTIRVLGEDFPLAA